MAEDQTQAPILEAIKAYHDEQVLPFTTPGHKMGRGVDPYTLEVLGQSTFYNDLSELAGLDDRHMSKGVQTRAEQLAAEVYGADQTSFSTNGSSLSAHVALLAVANPGDTVLFARNMHKSVVAAMILSGVRPAWLYPPTDTEMNVQHGVTPQQVDEALAANPNLKAVMITSPDYYGVASDLEGIAEASHRHGVPLIVDEAWGPHFPFHPDLPPFGMECGADISLGSVHKTMNGIQQASVINTRGDLVDQERLTLCFDLFETTSSTSLITGSIDGARRYMALHGTELWGRTLELSRRAREAVAQIPGMKVMGREVLERPGAFALDETKFVVDVQGLGMTGVSTADWLRQHCQIEVELADQRRILAILSVADDEVTVDRLINALRDLASWAESNSQEAVVTVASMDEMRTEPVCSPREVFLGPAKRVEIDKAVGETAAEMLSPYPPGIPAIIPGERFTRPIIEFLQAMNDMGVVMPDASDSSLKTVRVAA